MSLHPVAACRGAEEPPRIWRVVHAKGWPISNCPVLLCGFSKKFQSLVRWNNGILEYWSAGSHATAVFPSFHHSIIPLLRHCGTWLPIYLKSVSYLSAAPKWLLWVLVCWAAGCAAPEARFEPNAPFIVAQERNFYQLPARHKHAIEQIIVHWFGTPDQPSLPPLAEVAETIDLQQVQLAAGPASSEQLGTSRGLYRKYCSACHGITGNGIGPVASLLDPYPRDFRAGVFKFKSTSAYERPTDGDLRRILLSGIPGTSMPSFRLLAEEQIETLVHYVKYLTLRGEVERALVFELFDSDIEDWDIEDKDIEEGDAKSGDTNERPVELTRTESDPQLDDNRLEAFLPIVAECVQPWRQAARRITPVPEHPVDWDQRESIALGRQLYFGLTANCVACHGETAQGEGQSAEYDEWTKEVVNPTNENQVRRYMDLGGLAPRPILPRNLRHGVFRGGSQPASLYRRIHDGIRGMPMPPTLMRPDDAKPDDHRLTSDDIWHLVDYIQNLPYESKSEVESRNDGMME
jgi:mono/diheme cytochrome c family protein